MKKAIFSLFILIYSFSILAQSDNCATATVVTLDPAGQACVTGTTTNATSANTFYGACNPANTCNEVWYTFVTNGANNVFDVIPNGLSNPEIVIYTGGCGGTLETCNTQAGTGTMSTNWGLPAGTQVWVGVMSNQGTEGGFDLCINSTAPNPGGGNTCAGAIPLCDINAVTTVDMTTITPSGDWPDCFGGAVNNDVWFTFTCTQSGTLEWEATPTGTGAGLVELDWALYDITTLGGCPNAIGNSAGDPSMSCNYNYDGGNGAPAGMTNPAGGEYNAPVNIVAGNTYVIIVDYFSGGGTGDMQFDFLPGMTAQIAPVADFTINPAGPTCAASVTVSITDNSTGVPTYDFGDGSPTYTGNNPPNHTYNTPGTYAITASIGGACPSTHTEFVELYGPLATVPTITPETCPGDCDGSISIATTGGSGQYTYSWNPGGQTTPSISNICSGNYSVTITDAVCGNLVEPINVAAPPPCVSCVMDSMPIVMTNCYSTPFLGYDVSGNLYFTDPPTTGTLTITPCSGAPIVFNAPFVSPIGFNFTGLPQTGTNCAFTATFSADPACTITTNFLSPPPITGFTLNQNNCVNGSYQLSGTVSFSNPPATGTLTVSYNDGVSTIDTVINAPFTSPENWSLSAPANGNNYTITVYFSGYPTCAVTYTGTAEPPCGCLADVGTFSTSITPNNGQSPYKLCFGDQFTLTSNGDFVPPDSVYAPPPAVNPPYAPGIGYLIYSCPPTIAVTPSNTPPNDNITNDPCFVGVVGFGNSFDDINFLGGPSYAGAWTNNTIYYVPITFYDTLSNPPNYSYVFAGNNPCYEMGPAFAVQYLTEITTASVEDCQDSSVTVTVTGGLPEFDGSLYTATNLQPANASFVNNTCTHNGTIVINGLLDGDMYSFDIVDTNGCPVTVTGGPFVGLPNANAGVDDTSCTLSYVLNPTTSFGTGTWTGPAGVNFAPNANTPNATVSAATAGTYTLTWTEDNGGGCTSSDNVDITLLQPIATAGVEDCQDSSVTITITNGLPEVNGSNYTASNLQPANASFVNNTCTHNGTIVINGLLDGDMYSFDITDDNGCTATFNGGPFIGLPNANAGVDDTSCTLSYALNPTTSFGTGTWTGPAGVNFAPNANTPNATVTVPAAGTYTLTWTEDNGGGCTSSDDVDIRFNILSIPNTPTNPTCNNGTDGQIILAPQGGTAPYSYQWDAAAGNQITNPATNLGAGSYTVTVTDAFGCFLDSTFTLTEPAPFTYTTDAQNANCNNPDGWAAVINFAGGNGGYTYDWGAGPTANDTLFNLVPNSYSVTVADANGCDTTFSITVGNNPTFTASITASTNVSCNGLADGDASADGSDPTATYNFSWNTVPVQNTQTATGLAAGTYIVTVTDAATGCTDTASITITEPPVLTVNAGNDVTICNGANTNISATGNGGAGAYQYTWNNGLPNGQAHNVAPTVDTDYIVTVTDANNCTAEDTVTVFVSPALTVVASADVTICPGGQANISAIAADGNGGPYNYNWSNGVGSGQNHTVSPASTTTYIVTASDGCTSPDATDSVTVFVSPLPTVAFLADTLSLCETPLQSIEFYNMSPSPSYNEVWTFGDGSNGAGDTVSHVYNAPGSYDVSLTITDSVTGCTNSDTQVGYINIHPNPTADFTMNPQPATMFDPTVDFYDQSYTNITQWYWDIAGLDTSILPNPSYTFPEDTGNYIITLTVIDANGCTNTISKTAIVKGEFGIYVPNAFTPDFDNLNEGFYPNGFGISEFDYGFYIFDRWGEIIFESHQKFEPWDGTYKGKLVQNGVYVWKLEFRDINGEQHSKVGHVNVIR